MSLLIKTGENPFLGLNSLIKVFPTIFKDSDLNLLSEFNKNKDIVVNRVVRTRNYINLFSFQPSKQTFYFESWTSVDQHSLLSMTHTYHTD